MSELLETCLNAWWCRSLGFALASETFSTDCPWIGYQTWCTTSELTAQLLCWEKLWSYLDQSRCCWCWTRGNTVWVRHWELWAGDHVWHQMALRRGRRVRCSNIRFSLPVGLHPFVAEYGVHGELSAWLLSQVLISSHIINFFLLKFCSLHWH